MIEEIIGPDPRQRVIVARSEWIFWQGADPLECVNRDCGSAFDVVRDMQGTLNVFTNAYDIANAWGIPMISDRWGRRPSETLTLILDGNGVISHIYGYADLDDLHNILSSSH